MARQIEHDVDEFLKTINRCWLSIKQAGRWLLAERDFDLTFEQLMVLYILDEKDGQNLRDLAILADRERTTMTRMVDGLERRSLVVRVPDKTDGRSKLVYLTRRGRQRTAELEDLKQQFMRDAFKGLTRAEITKATKVLERIAEMARDAGSEK